MAQARQQYTADGNYIDKQNKEFTLTDEIMEKLDSIEPSAERNAIQGVKVNGELQIPDQYRVVSLTIPEVEDNLESYDNKASLSARQGRVLYNYIKNLQSLGRYLSNWNSATGLPMTNPSGYPYDYHTGDYFVISNVAASGGTNYRPDGATYQGQASTVVETEEVAVSDIYFYDGEAWLLMSNSARAIAVDTSLSTSSENPVENRVITNALNTKQEKIVAGNNITINADGKTINAVDTTYDNLPAEQGGTADSLVTTGDKYNWDNKQGSLTAGANIQIAQDGTISATDTKYTAGTGISISANNVISNTQSSGDMFYSDFNWETKTGTAIELSLNSEITPTANFTVNKPADLKDGQTYLLRVNNGATAYTMTLGTNVTNPYSEDLTLEPGKTELFVFMARGGNLELQPSSPITAGRNIDLTNNVANLKLIDVTVNTAYNVADKIGTTTAGNYMPTIGDLLLVNFVNGCSIANPTLNIDGSGEINIRVGGVNATTINFPLGTIENSNVKIILYYDGTYYRSYGMFNGYSSMRESEIEEATSTSNRVISPVNLKYAVETHAPVQSVNGQTGDVVIDEGNTKTFYLSSTSDLTTAQEAYDWIQLGNEAIIEYNNAVYLRRHDNPNVYLFRATAQITKRDSTVIGTDSINYRSIQLLMDGNTVSSITFSNNSGRYIDANTNYSTPYTPQYNGSPATKKYVDDSIGNLKYLKRIYVDYPFTVGDDWSDVFSVIEGGDSAILADDMYRTGLATYLTYLDSSTKTITVITGEDTYKVTLDSNNTISAIKKAGEMRRFDSPVTAWGPNYDITDIMEHLLAGGNACVYDDAEDQMYYVVRFYVYNSSTLLVFSDNTGSFTYQPTKTGNKWYAGNGTYSAHGFYLPSGTASGKTLVSTGGANTAWTRPGAYDSTTAPTSPARGNLWRDRTNSVLKVYNGSSWEETGKEYNAGKGIAIGTYNDYSAMQGPAPTGYHVPSTDEWIALCGILTTTFSMASNATTMGTYLKIPMAGGRTRSSASVNSQGVYGLYWSSTAYSSDSAYFLNLGSSSFNPQYATDRAYGHSVRCFKDTPIIPTSSWTTLYDGSSVATGAGVFYNATDGLISVSGDGQTWYTIMDKNLGATTVYNNGDTLSEANCGKYYQWGNNYGFAWTGSITTSSTKVDASVYGPGNYYSSSTFIIVDESPYDWSSVQNDNLWGGVTGVVTLNNAITNTGVTSVNGQTGDVTVDGGNTKTFYLSSTTDYTVAQEAYDWYLAGKNPIIYYLNRAYIIYSTDSSNLYFRCLNLSLNDGTSTSSITIPTLRFSVNTVTSEVSGILSAVSTFGPFIRTNSSYSTPFTPSSDGDPATKKYVDDSVASAGITKIFTLSGTGTGATVLAEAQAAYDWYVAGNLPIIKYGSSSSVFYNISFTDNSTHIYFTNSFTNNSNETETKSLRFGLSNGSVTGVTLHSKRFTITTSVPSSGSDNTIYFIK